MTKPITSFNVKPHNLPNLVAQLTAMANSGEDWVVSAKLKQSSRSILQNNLSHSWYAELEANIKEDDALGYKAFCKLHFGVPILRAENEEFRLAYDTSIKPLSYEAKLAIMKILPVTSLMDTKQLTKYLDAMRDHYDLHNGYLLKYPSDW